MKTPHASSGILEINYKSPPCLTWISPNKLKNCLVTKTEYLPYFIVKFKIKCLSASWLSIAFSDSYFQVSLMNVKERKMVHFTPCMIWYIHLNVLGYGVQHIR